MLTLKLFEWKSRHYDNFMFFDNQFIMKKVRWYGLNQEDYINAL